MRQHSSVDGEGELTIVNKYERTEGTQNTKQ